MVLCRIISNRMEVNSQIPTFYTIDCDRWYSDIDSRNYYGGREPLRLCCCAGRRFADLQPRQELAIQRQIQVPDPPPKKSTIRRTLV